MAGNCCGEGECLFCLSLPLLSLPGKLSHGFPQSHHRHLLPVVTLSFPWSPGSLGRAAVGDTKRGCGRWRTRGWDSPSCRCGNRWEGKQQWGAMGGCVAVEGCDGEAAEAGLC